MIKVSGQKFTATQAARQIVISGIEMPAAMIDRYLDDAPTDKESEAIFAAIEKIRIRLCDKWNFSTHERTYR